MNYNYGSLARINDGWITHGWHPCWATPHPKKIALAVGLITGSGDLVAMTSHLQSSCRCGLPNLPDSECSEQQNTLLSLLGVEILRQEWVCGTLRGMSAPGKTLLYYLIHNSEAQGVLMSNSYQYFEYHVSCTDGKISVRISLFLLLIFPP